MFAQVIVDISISETDKIFDYAVPPHLLVRGFSALGDGWCCSGIGTEDGWRAETCKGSVDLSDTTKTKAKTAAETDGENPSVICENDNENLSVKNTEDETNTKNNVDIETYENTTAAARTENSSGESLFQNPQNADTKTRDGKDGNIGEGCVELRRGQRVLVPFGNRNVEGYVVGLCDKSDCPPEKIKPITGVLDKIPVISEEMFRLAGFMQTRYNLKLVDAMRLFIPAQMRGGRVKELTRLFARLNPDSVTDDPGAFIKPSALAQRELYDYLLQSGGAFVSELNKNFSASALKNLTARGIVITEARQIMRSPNMFFTDTTPEFILTSTQKDAVRRIGEEDGVFLLHGVTGSGKTEVYMNAITAALKKGKTAIMLVPEISLTPQVFARFKSRFGDRVAILHSGLSAGERFDEWTRLLTGEASIAVGARSAIFAPISNVGIIIIDEEHDQSYSSESNPRYITHEVASFRSDYNDCNLVLGSATPSVETYYKAQKGEYTLLEMPARVGGSTLPEIKVVNMCNELYSGNSSMFSAELFSRLTDCMSEGNQAMLFINRRGYSSFLRCLACGYVAECERCDVSLVLHKDEGALKCHYCGGRYGIPDICPKCGSQHFRRGYIGTQQVEEKLQEMFPRARILRMDNDTTQSKDMHAEILGRFKNREADILIGTQMIAKGHDFGAVTLVGIMDADVSLHFADYKSCERTFQLITQVAGRAGRADKKGSVVLQTYCPSHYAYRFAISHDYRGFYKKEVNLREVTSFPPFANILRILVAAEKEQAAAPVLKSIYDGVRALDAEYKGCFAFLTYMFAPVKRIKDITRMQVLCRITQDFDKILPRIYSLVNGTKTGTAKVFVEINPNSLN